MEQVMELRQLRHFLSVVDTGSFSAAAKHVGVSQQALSKSIAALEGASGVRLFDRDTRNLKLTPFGDMLLAHARNIEAETQQFHRHVDDVLGVKSGRLMIGAGPSAAGHVVADAVARLALARPKLRISVIDGNAETLTPMLLRGALDAIVCVEDEPSHHALVATETLFHQRVRLLAGASHPLAGQRKVKLVRTTEYPWLLGWRTAGLARAVTRLFAARDLKPPTTLLDTTSVTFARAILGLGRHLAVLPEHLFAPELTSGVLSAVALDADLSDWINPVVLSYRRNATRSPATMAFVTQLYEIVGKPAKAAVRDR